MKTIGLEIRTADPYGESEDKESNLSWKKEVMGNVLDEYEEFLTPFMYAQSGEDMYSFPFNEYEEEKKGSTSTYIVRRAHLPQNSPDKVMCFLVHCFILGCFDLIPPLRYETRDVALSVFYPGIESYMENKTDEVEMAIWDHVNNGLFCF